MGDKKAFLSMYATVIAAGRRAFQLERSCQLQHGTDDATAVREVCDISSCECGHTQANSATC